MARLTRPPQLRAGFHADVDDPDSGLHHAGEQWAAPRYLITPHAHPVWEFYLQVHGVTRWVVGPDQVSVRPGELLGVPPAVRHHMSEPAGGNHHFYFAAVDLATVLDRHASLATAWPDEPRLVHRAGGRPLIDAFDHVVREVATTSPFSATGLRTTVDLLVLQLSRLLLPGGDASLLAGHPAVARVRDRLDREFANPCTLRDLAASVGLAPTYLSGLFAAEVGCAPHAYLLGRRVHRAGQLLATSDLPITAIALEVGFGSSQHFARVFRRHTGSTPRDHRARARGRSRGRPSGRSTAF